MSIGSDGKRVSSAVSGRVSSAVSGRGFFVSYLAVRAAREDGLDVRMLVRPVSECIEALRSHGRELSSKEGDSEGQRRIAAKSQVSFYSAGRKKLTNTPKRDKKQCGYILFCVERATANAHHFLVIAFPASLLRPQVLSAVCTGTGHRGQGGQGHHQVLNPNPC